MSEVIAFEPGSDIRSLSLQRSANLIYNEVVLNFPSRIHCSPIDCNRFNFGKPGGGGIGFAIDLPNQITIARSNRNSIKCNDMARGPIVEHYVKVIKALLSSDECFKIDLKISELMHQHFGLGSSVSIACGVVFGLNKLFDTPFTITDMRRIIADNFVEEFKGKVSRGLETGVGTSVVLKGGISVIANEIVEILNQSFPENYSVFLIDPHTTRPNADEPESQDMLARTFFLDNSYRYTKAYDILMDIVPALEVKDMRRFGEYIWNIQFSGTHLSMIQSYEQFGKKIYDVLFFLRHIGTDVCGLSSVGPAIYAICTRGKASKFKQDITNYDSTLTYWEVEPNNSGIKIVSLK